MVEDQIVTATGSYSATSTQSGADWWIMQLAAFRAASGSDTTPPTAPTGLTASVVSSSQINLSWTASTDNVGVTGYRVESCSGASCTTFAQIATPTTTTFNVTGLSASTSYSFRVRATDAAGNLSGYSGIASGTTTTGSDTTPPTAPTSLTATAASASQISLSWAASTDNVGVTGYRVERCTGTSCTSFAQVGTPTGTGYSDTGLAASTSYSYRVRATDAAGNLSSYSPTSTAVTSAATGISYVQGTYQNVDSASSLNTTFASAQTAGNLNVIAVGWSSSVVTVTSISDSMGNTYVAAVGPTVSSGNASQRMYYAKSISAAMAGSNTVSVTFSAAVSYPEVRIMEYSGLDPSSPFDVGIGASGTGSGQSSGAITTTSANDVLVAVNYLDDSTTAIGPGYTQRFITNGGDLVEDEIVTSTGSYSATSTQNGADWWLIQVAAFRAAGGGSGGDTTPPTAPTGLTNAVASATQINLSWTASSDNVGVTGYLIESCSGASCTSFSQIGTSTTTSFSANGLTAATAYTFRIRATDAAGNLSGYSSTTSGTTSSGGGGDTTPPSAPTSPTASVVSSTQIAVSWAASTDNVGVTGYLIERCTGASCTTFAQIGTATTTSYSDTGLTASTSYSYRIRATDAAGNLSSYSNTVTSTTQAIVDTTPPSTPTGLAASVLSSSQITVVWNASTDNVGVTGYRVERCQGAGCSAFTQVGAPVGTSYSDVGLTGSTSYSYRVRASDAAGNLSGYSTVAGAATISGANSYTYDSNGHVVAITTSTGTAHYYYDAAGNVTSIGWTVP